MFIADPGRAKEDVEVVNDRLHNKATQTDPCIVHANGWDKGPLLKLLSRAHKLTDQEMADMIEQKATLEKTKVNIHRHTLWKVRTY